MGLVAGRVIIGPMGSGVRGASVVVTGRAAASSVQVLEQGITAETRVSVRLGLLSAKLPDHLEVVLVH